MYKTRRTWARPPQIQRLSQDLSVLGRAIDGSYLYRSGSVVAKGAGVSSHEDLAPYRDYRITERSTTSADAAVVRKNYRRDLKRAEL